MGQSLNRQYGISTNKSVKVSVKFDTKGTDSVLDDEIVEITEIR